MKELQVKVNGENKLIYFGVPDNENEILEMHKLRYEIYSKKDYIYEEKFKDGIEKDEYDLDKKSHYFIAKIEDRIIGSVRLIRDYYLPTEKDFKFEEPEEMKKIPREQRGETGRLVITPYSKEIYLPRNIILLFLIDCLLEFSVESHIAGGYSFVKSSLLNKLNKLEMPIHIIKNYIQVYPKDGILYKYFNQEDDKVIPIYIFTDEVKKYLNGLINNRKMFEKISEKKFILRENLYNGFLKFLKII